MLAIAVAVVDAGASITATTCIFTPTVNPGSDSVPSIFVWKPRTTSACQIHVGY